MKIELHHLNGKFGWRVYDIEDFKTEYPKAVPIIKFLREIVDKEIIKWGKMREKLREERKAEKIKQSYQRKKNRDKTVGIVIKK